MMRHALITLSLVATVPIGITRAQESKRSPAPSGTAPAAARFKVVTELPKEIRGIFQDSKGAYWFNSHTGGREGLYRLDKDIRDQDEFAHFTTDSGLPSNFVGQLQEDRFGTLYISTSNGICTFDGRAFTALKLDESEPAVTEVKLGPDILWFGGGGEKPHIVFHDGKSLRKLKMPTTAAGDAHYASLPRDKFPNAKYSPYDVGTIYTDSRGNVWFGTSSLGACRFDGKTFAWISQEELAFNEKNGQNFSTRSIIEDREGKFWITNTRHRYEMYPTPAAGIATEGAGGLRYIKTAGLAHRADGEDEHYTFIQSMVKDKAGNIWMSTYGAGVWKYDGKTLKHYPVMVDGKPITVISIYRDREDGLWLGTHEHGVCKFDGKAFKKVTFK